MAISAASVSKELLTTSRRELAERLAPQIVKCLRRMDEDEIWWRPNAASNSAGNLVLHLSGNVRQWVIAGLGRTPDYRQRDREFGERGGIPRSALIKLITQTAEASAKIFDRLTPADLMRKYSIQGYRVTGLYVVYHVVTHFGQHTGQIVILAKSVTGRDLKFTKLPKAPPVAAPPARAAGRLLADGPMWPWLDAQRSAVHGRAC